MVLPPNKNNQPQKRTIVFSQFKHILIFLHWNFTWFIYLLEVFFNFYSNFFLVKLSASLPAFSCKIYGFCHPRSDVQAAGRGSTNQKLRFNFTLDLRAYENGAIRTRTHNMTLPNLPWFFPWFFFYFWSKIKIIAYRIWNAITSLEINL